LTANFRVSKSTLQNLLAVVSPVIPSTAALPILQCIKVIVNPLHIQLEATKLDNSIVARSDDLQCIEELDFVVPFKRFKEIVSRSDNGDLDLLVEGSTLTITAGAASWSVQLPAGDTYPAIPKVEGSFKLDGRNFRDYFDLIRKSASSDVTRPSLRMIHISQGKMTACDGIKLSQAYLGDEFLVDLTFDIPSASAEFVMHVLKNCDEILVGRSATHTVIETSSTRLIMSNPTSSYPNVEQIMLRPALENKILLKIDRNDFLKAFNRVRINADPDTEAVGLLLAATSLTLSTKDMTGNTALETIPADWSAKDRTIIVNSALMAQLLQSSSEDDCSIFLGEDTKSRKSLIMLKDKAGITSVIPQMSGNIRIF